MSEPVEEAVAEEVIEEAIESEETGDISGEESTDEKSVEEEAFDSNEMEFELPEEDGVEEDEEDTRSVKEILNEELTIEEKRTYGSTNKWVMSQLEGSEYEGSLNEIMSNPSLVKVFTVIAGKSVKVQGRVPEPKAAIPKVTEDSFYDELNAILDEHRGNPEELAKAKAALGDRVQKSKGGDVLYQQIKSYI